jgi:hypothetical protein
MEAAAEAPDILLTEVTVEQEAAVVAAPGMATED